MPIRSRLRRLFEAVNRRAVTLVSDSSEEGRRRSALALTAIMASLGFALGFMVGGAAAAPGEQLLSAMLVALLVAVIALPVSPRIRWPAAAIIVPLCFAIGVRPLESSDAFIGLLVVPVAWAAALLTARLVGLLVAVSTLSVWWALETGSFDGRTTAATGLWFVIFTMVAWLVGGLARGLRQARKEVDDIGEALGFHFYRGSLEADGTYTETYTGRGADRLLGGVPPKGVSMGEVWDGAIHPEDATRVEAWLRGIGAGNAGECEYRLVGMDGVVRWVLDRARVTGTTGGRVTCSLPIPLTCS